MDILELDNKYVANTYARYPLEIIGGHGAVLHGNDGKHYIDLGSGIAVNTFGMGDESWREAVTTQLSQFQHTSNYYYTAPCTRLAEMLCVRTGMSRVFFSNSGAEANEGAIKAARRRAFLKHGDEEHSTVITLKNSFHGRTITTLAATGQDNFHTEFGPFTPGFVYADPADASDMRRLANENACCAVMMEMVQGEGGVYNLQPGFVAEVLEIAREKDLLVIVDEVQTGNGRTGKLYSYMHYGFKPDIFTTAKGLAGGLPLGAVVLGDKVKDVFSPGTHGSTFGGNPISCAGALSILSRLDDTLFCEVMEKSEYIRSELSGAPGVTEVSGLGLMLGISCTREAGDVVRDCMECGVLALSAKDKVRLLPPLNIPMETLKPAIDILKEVLAG